MSAIATPPAGIRHDHVEGQASIELAAGDLTATFLPGLGMAGVSLRHAGQELLDRQGGLAAYARDGAVMGLPLLHPWANRLSGDAYEIAERRVTLPRRSPLVRRDANGLPIHGLLAASPHWRVAAIEAVGDLARLRAGLNFGAHGDLLAGFPFPHELTIEATLTPERLAVVTSVRATADVAVPISFGHHPYLRLPGVDRSAWQIVLPPRRHLQTDERGIPTGAGTRHPPIFFALNGRGFDDGYDGLAPGATFQATGGERRIAVTLHAGYPAAQVYSPPGAQFICFEPMTAPTDALRSGTGLRRVAPGERFAAMFSITAGWAPGARSAGR